MQTNWNWFVLLCCLGWFLNGLVLFLSWQDHYLTVAQVHAGPHPNDIPSLYHGGVLAEFILTPVLALELARYRPQCNAIAIILALIVIATVVYQVHAWALESGPNGTGGTGINHNGSTPPAGYVHAIFMGYALWAIAVLMFGQTTPIMSGSSVLWLAVGLSGYAIVATRMWLPGWWTRFYSHDFRQIATVLILVWLCFGVRTVLIRFHLIG